MIADRRVDVHHTTVGHNTSAFYLACYRGHADVVRVLAPVVNVMQANSNGASPFYIACQRGRTAVVKELLRNEAVDCNRPNATGITPFFTACENGRLDVVKLLVRSTSVDVNRRDDDNFTPLAIACWRGCTDVVRLGAVASPMVLSSSLLAGAGGVSAATHHSETKPPQRRRDHSVLDGLFPKQGRRRGSYVTRPSSRCCRRRSSRGVTVLCCVFGRQPSCGRHTSQGSARRCQQARSGR